MFACICHAVTEEQLVSAVLQGGCDSVESIGEATEAGTSCGCCVDRIEGVLAACGQVCSIEARRCAPAASLVG